MSSFSIFCADCHTYLPPSHVVCPVCAKPRPANERLTAPGETLWQTPVGGPVNGIPLIAGGLLLAGWGTRHGAGGVSAIDITNGQERWVFKSNQSIEGAISIDSGQVFCVSNGIIGGGAQLHCLDMWSGNYFWPPQTLPGGVWCPPLVDDVRIYTATDNGVILAFNRLDGKPIPDWHIQVGKGRIWAALSRHGVVIVNKDGQVQILNILRPKNSLRQIAILPNTITLHSLSLVDDNLYAGTDDGEVYRVDLARCKVRRLAEKLVRVTAAPTIEGKVLFVGAFTRHVHALDWESGREIWKSEAFEHSISSAVWTAGGLIFACANGGEVSALETEKGQVGWRFNTKGGVQLLSAPLVHEGVIYFGSDQGQVYAIPWHGGDYAWAAQWLEKHSQPEQAAEHSIFAAHFNHSADERNQAYHQAARLWEQTGKPESAAQMWEELAQYAEAAKAYCSAAEHQRGRNNLKSAEYYFRAARLYWRLEDSAAEENSMKKACELGKWPKLRIVEKNAPALEQHKPGLRTIRVHNAGFSEAPKLAFTIGGSLKEQLKFEVHTPLEKDKYFDLSFELVPTKPHSYLEIEVAYQDKSGQHDLQVCLVSEIDAVQAPHIIHIGDAVKSKVKIINPDNQPVEFYMGDMVCTELELQFGETSNANDKREVKH